ncbi:MAG: RNA polymerase sigma-70 factor [Mangrovibacterium sp.]
MIYSDDSIKTIVRDLANGDKQALDEIYKFFYPKLYAFAKSFLKVEDNINDILQDVFVKLWMNREKINRVDTFNSYLFTIAKNTIVSYFRDKTRDLQFETRIKAVLAENQLELHDELEYKELKSNIDAIIDQLPEKRKQIFILSREDGLSNNEISEKLGISVKTVEDHMTHALKFIRKNMETMGMYAVMYSFLFI